MFKVEVQKPYTKWRALSIMTSICDSIGFPQLVITIDEEHDLLFLKNWTGLIPYLIQQEMKTIDTVVASVEELLSILT